MKMFEVLFRYRDQKRSNLCGNISSNTDNNLYSIKISYLKSNRNTNIHHYYQVLKIKNRSR